MNIHYVVAVFLGPRRSQPQCEPLYFVKQHLKFLQKSNFSQVTFVCNKYKPEFDVHLPIIVQEAKLPMPANVILRNNIDCSYGAWEHAIIQNIDKNLDYHFLIEDDFVPTYQNFINHFLEKMKPNVAYTCSRLFHSPLHAAISNGLLSHQITQKIFKEKGKAFNLNGTIGTAIPLVVGIKGVPWPLPNYRRILRGLDYQACERNQIHFLDFFTEKGYQLDHIADLVSVPFRHAFQTQNVNYGNETQPPAIIPIDPPKNIKLI